MDLPTQPIAAAVVLSGPTDHVLMVLTHHRSALVLPGGMVEAGESPAAAAEREVLEEVGLHVEVTRLLAVAHASATERAPSGLFLVFDSTPLPARPDLVLQPEEIAEAHWVPVGEAVARHVPRGQPVLHAALSARAAGAPTAYVDDRVTLPRW